MTDRSAEVARYIMTRKKVEDSRHLVFDLLQVFHGVPPEQIVRGVAIALELYEAEEVQHVFTK